MEHDRYDPTRRYPPNRLLSTISGSASFPLLEFVLNPTRTSLPMQDAILVSIDFEYRYIKSVGKTQITQVGTASLDTRILADIDTNDPKSLVDAVRVRVFNIYPKRAFSKTWVPTSLWATPEKIRHDEIPDKLNEIFFNQKGSSSTIPGGPRDVILIGHGIHSDHSLLIAIADFDLKRVASIRAIVDTGRMMCSAYDFGIATHSHFPLRWILRCLAIRYDQIHDAGNDAMFTMKAMLLMFCNWKDQKGRHLWNVAEDIALQPSSTSISERMLWDCQLETLTAIARESWHVAKKPAFRRPTTINRPAKAETNLILSAEDLDLVNMFR